jgi:hypothetical protein
MIVNVIGADSWSMTSIFANENNYHLIHPIEFDTSVVVENDSQLQQLIEAGLRLFLHQATGRRSGYGQRNL